jgi:SAM-dependent methyltransferase
MNEPFIFSPHWRLSKITDARFQLFSQRHRRAFELNQPMLQEVIHCLSQPFTLDQLRGSLETRLQNAVTIYELLLKQEVVIALAKECLWFSTPEAIRFHPLLPLDSLLPGDEWVKSAAAPSPLSVICYRPQPGALLEWSGAKFTLSETKDFWTFPQVVVCGAGPGERLELRRLAQARYQWVFDQLACDQGPVLNYGCGYGSLEHFFLSRQKSIAHWVSVDRDPETIQRASFPEAHRSVVWDFDHAPSLPRADTLVLIEVIEHWPLERVKEQLLRLVELVQPKKILLSVPNNDLNWLYGGSKGFRHADHQWEMGTNAMSTLFHDIFKNVQGVRIIQSGVGKSYGSSYVTNAWIIHMA